LGDFQKIFFTHRTKKQIVMKNLIIYWNVVLEYIFIIFYYFFFSSWKSSNNSFLHGIFKKTRFVALGLSSSTLPHSIDADLFLYYYKLMMDLQVAECPQTYWIIQHGGPFYDTTFVVGHRILLQMFRVASHSDNLSTPSDACGTLVTHAMWRTDLSPQHVQKFVNRMKIMASSH
jgi:hypothetical protein